MTAEKRPSGLRAAGRRLWDDVTATYTLRPDERVALAAACRLADECARLERELTTAPTITAGSTGQPVVHPLFAALEKHRAALAAQLAAVGLADAHRGNTERVRSTKARRAANVRWHGAAS